MRILVTGGCGFIGNHVVRNALLIPGVERVVNLDLLTYSGNLENLKDVDDSRYQFVHGSINDSALVETLLGDPSKAQKKLGWRPKVSFEHLVREMVKHDFEQVRAEKMTPTSKLTQDDNERK